MTTPASVITFLLYFTLCYSTFVSPSYGQNLLFNPGFETSSACPTGYNQTSYLSQWQSGNSGSPDYFNCVFYGNVAAGVPSEGNGLIGFWGGPNHASCPGSGLAENIDGPLLMPLTPGKTYTLSFDLQIDGTGNLTNPPNDCMNFGFYFYQSSNPPLLSGVCCPTVTPQVSVSGSLVQQGIYKRFSEDFTPAYAYDRVLIGAFCQSQTSNPACSSYSGKKMYFNLDNMTLEEETLLPLNMSELKILTNQTLLWSVSNPESISYFEVMRCRDNCESQESFTPVSVILPEEFPQGHFSYSIPVQPTSQTSWKIRAVLPSGGEYFSNIVTATNSRKPDAQFSIYPNPTQDNIRLHIPSNEAKTARISIRDLRYRLIFQADYQLFAGENIISIDRNCLSSGIYLVDYKGEQQKLIVR